MQERAIKTKNKILKSGIKNFSKYGYSGATIDEIAKSSKVNKQRIYAYFESKTGLFNACLAKLFAEVEIFSENMIEEAQKHPENLTKILFEGFFNVHEKYPEFRRLLGWANLEADLDSEVLEMVRKKENLKIEAILKEAVQNKLIKTVDSRIYILNLMAIAYFYHSNYYTLQQTLKLPSCETISLELQNIFKE